MLALTLETESSETRMHSRVHSFLLLALLAATPALAEVNIGSGDCDIHSDYSLTIKPDSLEFSKKNGKPSMLTMANGSLVADGQTLQLSAADRSRVRDIERGVRELEPDIKGVARDAIAIALGAVTEVNASFASDPAQARESALRIQRNAAELEHYVMSTDTISEVEVSSFIGKTVTSLIGELVGNIAAQALKVAFSGDEKAAAELEARANGIEKAVEKITAKRSKSLEQRTSAMCTKFQSLQKLQDALEVRLPDGKPLRLGRAG